jgi:hypothetical protein
LAMEFNERDEYLEDAKMCRLRDFGGNSISENDKLDRDDLLAQCSRP